MGNYKGFGDSKIVPNVPLEKLDTFFQGTKAFSKNTELQGVWDRVKKDVYDLETRRQQLGLGEKGITTYFSANCTSADADLVNRYFKSIQMEGYNNRVLKTIKDEVTHYEVGFT